MHINKQTNNINWCHVFQHVDEILTDAGAVKGVRVGATEYHAPIVLAGTTPKVAFLDLMKKVSVNDR